MDWRRVPSVFSLRAFEAVARSGSLTKAAAELNVTHAAISQHIKKLEQEFGLPLTFRQGRGTVLTKEGRELARGLASGFSKIAESVEAVHQGKREKPLSISLTPTFAEGWLLPRLGDFWAKHPDISVSLNPSVAVTDFDKDDVDLAIRYGLGDWPGTKAICLTPARFLVLSARGRSRPSSMVEETWLLETRGFEQRRWVERLGLLTPQSKVREFQSYPMVHTAALAGLGLWVGQAGIVQAEIDAGVFDVIAEDDNDEFSYHIVTPERSARPEAKVFSNWLLEQAGC